MPSDDERTESPIGVGVVGVRPDEEGAIPVELPQGRGFELVAFSDEGLEAPVVHERPVAYYSDYNVLLQDPQVELVLVDGPVELRRDFAVRALNAGRHAVLREPFGESAADAERVMKTALRRGLVATMEVEGRDDADLLALRRAIEEENVPGIQGAFCFWPVPESPASATIEAPPAVSEWADPSPAQPLPVVRGGALDHVGFALLYQMRLLVRDDVKSVNAHLQCPRAGAPDEAFLLYLALRGGGWAIAQGARNQTPGMPRWVLHAPQAIFTARDGSAIVVTGDQQRTYAAPHGTEDFWANLHAAVRRGAELKCHPVDIVRAMKLHEAALASAETGEPVTV